ncbi:hypothetical protein [Azospirillum lipoferum]|uniref:Uncharacterized protein n=1 Tax=Azospirillum lipoferum (strain 4B) TaxID=862719 RepID=G7Z5H0_AZOL4|nr:hypothetical protein [Azospirillum lipoferum]CBS87041.1 protein of unknown function [Azospirillum lipoferum 4B]
MLEPLTEWPQPPRRSMRSTIAAVDALATPSIPTQGTATHRLPDRDAFTIGLATGYAAGILTAAAVITVGWWVMVGW